MSSSACGCCQGPLSVTPVDERSRPGLSAIVFRAGTYSTFRFAMLQEIARMPALSALRTRRDDDYAITLLDMWATIADVLTFYEERIANESYLRTARLRDSVLRMARLLDYRLRPGVAAGTLLAFTLDRGASLLIPTGLRVQSVPAQDEKPQKYETLQTLQAESALNRVRVVPAPLGFNPLARGNTSAILAPGPEGDAPAAALAPGDRAVIFDEPSGALEEITVKAVRAGADNKVLAWTGPLQHSGWDITTPVYAVKRTFRLFGHNAPSQYMESSQDAPGIVTWNLRIFTASDYGYSPASGVLELDAKYEGIAAGSLLLITETGRPSSLVTVVSSSQGKARFVATGATTTPVEDTVTRVAVTPPPPPITDRRNVVIYEAKGPRIRFWGYCYPETVTGSTVFAPAERVDDTTVRIAGAPLSIKQIETGRKILLLDSAQPPTAAVVSAAAVSGVDVAVAPTDSDITTAVELKLDSGSATPVRGLASAPLPATIALSNSARQFTVTIGALPPRAISLPASPSTLASAAALLEAALRGSLPPAPEFADARVLPIAGRLLLLPGVPGAGISVAVSAADSNTAVDLGLAAPDSRPAFGLLSGDLSAFPVLSNPLRQMTVTIGPIGPRVLSFSPAPSNLNGARNALANAFRAADPAPAFSQALVLTLGTRLLILPGLFGATVQQYLALTLQPEATFQLDAHSSALLGNVAPASHGETVADEVLGNGDASAEFQNFTLEKSPLTYLPSAGPGGVASTLRVFVNQALWSEVPSLYGAAPTDQIYTVRTGDDGKSTVGFGDGVSGARLPSGRDNVVADYRQGSGLAGRVRANSLTAPLDLPLGLKSVTNPRPSTGGADPESLDQARQNAPTTVRTFGRAVSLRDFEDLARSSGEVAKSLATWVWNGAERAVHLTIAGQQGSSFFDSDIERIYASLTAERDPNHPLFLSNFVRIPIVVTATVKVASNRVAKQVAAAAHAALLDAFSFESLAFGEPIALSVVYRVLQEVPGVVSVDIDRLHFKNQTPAFLLDRGASSDPVQRTLRTFSARPNPTPPPLVIPAEQAVIEAPADDLRIATSGGLPE